MERTKIFGVIIAVVTLVWAVQLCGEAYAWSPPKSMAISAYAYGASGNAYALAITEAVEKATGHAVRVIPRTAAQT